MHKTHEYSQQCVSSYYARIHVLGMYRLSRFVEADQTEQMGCLIMEARHESSPLPIATAPATLKHAVNPGLSDHAKDIITHISGS